MTALTVTTLETPPPPRTNALLLPSPSTVGSEVASNHLYMIFGEFFDGSRVTFYNSVLRYDIAKNEWREYKSGEGPAPRSSAAGVSAPSLGDGGGILIFGEHDVWCRLLIVYITNGQEANTPVQRRLLSITTRISYSYHLHIGASADGLVAI